MTIAILLAQGGITIFATVQETEQVFKIYVSHLWLLKNIIRTLIYTAFTLKTRHNSQTY